MNDEELSALIKGHANRHKASERLKAAVRTQITLHAAATPEPESAHPSDAWQPWGAWLGLSGFNAPGGYGVRQLTQLALAFVTGVLLTLALVVNYPHWIVHNNTSNNMVGDLLGLHVRSLGPGPLFQVGSSDRHTVKPWFQGKLDYAPEVPDLHDAGFDLLGGRIDRVQGHDTAVLAYQLRKHIISAYVLPVEQAVPSQTTQRRGFHIAHWSDGVMQIWTITDADVSELKRFESAWLAKVNSVPPTENR
ncbi:hypothetical protein [Rhodoferax sp. GW822-FHT02A01]|uniref:anti-sigma factor family protein n=1 Tax=Rhodoferax sp. GW822-FHT02A01 TaxID=3141537 RepID=UPI00315C72F2